MGVAIGTLAVIILLFLAALICIWKKRTPRERGRIGYYERTLVGASKRNKESEYRALYTIEEVERIGDQSRVKVLHVAGVDSFSAGSAWNLLDWTFVPTSAIKWKGPDPVAQAFRSGYDKGYEAALAEKVA